MKDIFNYQEFINYLFSNRDLNYKKFHSSLVLNSKYEMIGIRVPVQRKIAKGIFNKYPYEYLKNVKDKYYEEVLIEGLVISNIKDEKKFNKYFNKFIYKIDNWAICDSFCSSIKIIRKYEDKYFDIAIKLAHSNEEFLGRVGIVIILNHFIKENKLNDIYKMIKDINSDKYYINMALSWLICELYIKCPDKTYEFLKNNKINEFVFKKAISKINDSYRVKDKNKVNKLK